MFREGHVLVDTVPVRQPHVFSPENHVLVITTPVRQPDAFREMVTFM